MFIYLAIMNSILNSENTKSHILNISSLGDEAYEQHHQYKLTMKKLTKNNKSSKDG